MSRDQARSAQQARTDRDVESSAYDTPTPSALRADDESEQVAEAIERSEPIAHPSRQEALSLMLEVAHDMRSPLSAILFLIDTLRSGRSGAISPLQERQLGLAYGAAFGLSQLATDLIDCVRGGERLLDRHPVAFSIAEMLHSVRDIVQPMAEEKQLQIRLVSVAADARLGYPAALHRVLLNLVTNAIKFTSTGSVEIATLQRDGTRVAFAVTDSGEGIPPHILSELCEPFRRAKMGELYFSSAGLGLAICDKLVRVLGGELQITSSPQSGSTIEFELDLPIATSI